MNNRIVVWFSCGAASAVAAKLAVETYGDRCHVVYCDTLASEHPDNARFFADTHVFGYTSEETRRAASFEDHNPTLTVEWLLIDRGVTKQRCLGMLEQAGIKLPAMYSLGFDHNNCPGCVKSQAAGYWNRVRRNFPDVFERRVKQSRLIGVRLVKIDGERVFLDELPPDLDGPDDDIDCGPVCQIPLFPLFPLGRAS